MEINKLQEDLLQEFKEEKQMIERQLEIFEPLEAKLRVPAAARVLSKGTILFFEIVCYVLAGGSIALAVLMNRVYPFSVWDEMRYKSGLPGAAETPSAAGVQDFTSVLYVLCVVLCILFIIIAQTLFKIRQKNDVIHTVSKDLKTLVGQHLKRKAAIQSVESRHYMEDSFKDEPGEDEWIEDIKS